ncbi:MAG: hypothetical protein RLZ12_894, partial [Bacillota bacterium]
MRKLLLRYSIAIVGCLGMGLFIGKLVSSNYDENLTKHLTVVQEPVNNNSKHLEPDDRDDNIMAQQKLPESRPMLATCENGKREIKTKKDIIRSKEDIEQHVRKVRSSTNEGVVTDVPNSSPSLTVTTTAYSPLVGKWTSSGMPVCYNPKGFGPKASTVAVDPRIIPKGTLLFIEGYGRAIAADTGGAIKGKKIDLFFPSEPRCSKYGRRHNIKVWILGKLNLKHINKKR